MHLIDTNCPHCNAHLQVDRELKQATCEYCGATFLLEEEVKRVQLENAERAGYDFEKGRQKAQEEARLAQNEKKAKQERVNAFSESPAPAKVIRDNVSTTWTFSDGTGIMHTLVYSKNKVSYDGCEPIKIGKLKSKGSNMVETVYSIPNMEGNSLLLCLKGKAPVLACNGINVETGEAYTPTKLPGWIWVFYVLFIVNWFLFIGGAIGGAANGGGALLCSTIAGNNKMKTVAKVFACIGIYVGFTIVEAILAVAIVSASN